MMLRWPRLTRMALESRPPADHDFWYGPGWINAMGLTGGDPDSAKKIAAMWRAVFILSNAGVASLPCITYRRRPDGGRERAPGMPIYDLLHDGPNTWQTAPEYWDFVMRALVWRGNACSLIVPGRRGPVDQLIPLHPDRLSFVAMPGDRLGYKYRPSPSSPEMQYTEEEVWHVRVFAEGGKVGGSLLAHAADDLGQALTLARFGQRLFERAPAMSGVLEVPGTLDDETFKRTGESFRAATAGPENWHSVAILEQGTKWTKMGMTNEDAQFLQSREFSIRDIARWTGVKKYLLESEDTPNYNSIEAFQVEHVTYAIRPWAYAIEQAISKDLIAMDRLYFAEFLLDALMRGDPLKRAQTLEIQRRNGIVNADEWRELENRNRREDGFGGEYWGQPNLARERAASARPEASEEDEPTDDARQTRARTIAEAAAGRVVRRETAALTKAAQRHAQDPQGFATCVADFYQTHAAFVSEAMGLSEDEARRYCTTQRGRVEQDGLAGMDAWAHEVPAQLAQTALMLEGV